MRDDQGAVEEPGLAHVGDPAVDDDAGVEDLEVLPPASLGPGRAQACERKALAARGAHRHAGVAEHQEQESLQGEGRGPARRLERQEGNDDPGRGAADEQAGQPPEQHVHLEGAEQILQPDDQTGGDETDEEAGEIERFEGDRPDLRSEHDRQDDEKRPQHDGSHGVHLVAAPSGAAQAVRSGSMTL